MNPAKLGKLGSRTQLTWVTCSLGSPRLAGFRTQLKPRFDLGQTQLSIPIVKNTLKEALALQGSIKDSMKPLQYMKIREALIHKPKL